MTDYQDIFAARAERVATITLNRPDRLKRMDSDHGARGEGEGRHRHYRQRSGHPLYRRHWRRAR